jgi:hypothetical protein
MRNPRRACDAARPQGRCPPLGRGRGEALRRGQVAAKLRCQAPDCDEPLTGRQRRFHTEACRNAYERVRAREAGGGGSAAGVGQGAGEGLRAGRRGIGELRSGP